MTALEAATDVPGIDPDIPYALHYQIRLDLLRRIESGELARGTAIPSERELCDRYGVSRPTVRQATQELVKAHVLERRRGLGTFVAQPKIRQQLGGALGFTERMKREGRRPSTQLLTHRTFQARALDESVGAALALGPSDAVLQVVRKRLADDIPILLETVHVPAGRFPGIETVDFERESLYEVLRERYSVDIRNLRETLEPVLLTEHEAELLDTRSRRASIRATITSFDRSGRPVEHTISVVRGDASQYYIELSDGEDAGSGRTHLRQPQLEIKL
jgi:DNA-binding GntR family transcriptional regulator